MNSTSNSINNNFEFTPIKKIISAGFIIRLLVLLFILFVAVEWTDPYFITDDIKYERVAEKYLNYADSLVDYFAFSRAASGFMQPFWPWVMCISSYLFRSIYVSRFINILLSTFCIQQIYNLTFNISKNEKTALTAAKLFAFLPVTVLTCCFPIKDIFLTFAVLYCFNIFVELQSNEKNTIRKIVFCAALMIGIYFTRGGVTELMLIFLTVYVIQRYVKAHNYPAVFLIIILFFIAAYFMKDSILQAFQRKVDDYSDYALMDGGSFLRMSSLKQLYKMPFAYFFGTLQPIKTDLLKFSDSSWWLNVISYLNISIYPVAIGNFLYIFSKKKNLFFWLSTLIMYCSVIYLVLGVFRHYLFLIPIEMINFSLYKEQQKNVIIVYGASFLLLLLMLMMSFLLIN